MSDIVTRHPVDAGSTDEVLGTTGAAGDYLSHIIIQPAALACGTVVLKDGATTIFTMTAGTLADLSPRIIPFNCKSVNGAWKITTGADIAVLALGSFTQ